MGALTVEKRIEIACALRDLDKSHEDLLVNISNALGFKGISVDSPAFNGLSQKTFDIFIDILGLAGFKCSSDEYERDIYDRALKDFFNDKISNEELIDSISDFIE